MKWLALGVLSAATLTLTVASANSFQSRSFSPMADAVAAETVAGQFVTVDQDHATTGTARIVTENGQRYLVFDDAFDTARGPDVEVILYTGSSVPVSIEEADYITLGELQSFEGAQSYLIPEDVDLADYNAVGIWCQQFNVTFGYAPL